MQNEKQGRFMSGVRLLVSAFLPPLIALFIVNVSPLQTVEIQTLARLLDSSPLFFVTALITTLLTLVYMSLMEMMGNVQLTSRDAIKKYPREGFIYILVSTLLGALASATLSYFLFQAVLEVTVYHYINMMIIGALIGLVSGLILLAIRFYADAVIPSQDFSRIRRWHYS